MIINGFYKFSDVIVTLILFFVVGFIPALITTSTSIKFRNKFLQESSNLNLTKIKWLSYSIISGVLVSALMPFIIAFLFNGLGEISAVLTVALIFGKYGFFCSLIACVILLYKDRYFKRSL
ncbi:Hypothetical protein F387_01970 [Wohlfahrtiimonas chitiniclastica SH04]|uniref:Uncharacterized protein n=1 Tax=Wohlfahrtiimonas chitiniclastica SH04 TaxID=1261130 RepID=L8XTL7_9GAMM|nr:hypothetical protein [Wohlfahrtiimonas chitiniclastica]ELV07247.1 Hypothetical protein F387_01970 [Wohlfahrtiimonas chitiniclastica SH04]